MIPPSLLAECYTVPFWQKRLCPETPDRPDWQAPEPDGLSLLSSRWSRPALPANEVKKTTAALPIPFQTKP